MSHSDDLLSLVDRIHAAGIEPERWPSVAAELGAHFGARAVGMFIYHPGAPNWNFNVNLGVEAAWLERFQGDFTMNDNPCEVVFRSWPLGSVAADWMLMSRRELTRTRLFNEWAVPQGLQSAVLAKTAMDAESMGLLSMIRPREVGEWQAHEVDELHVLTQHLVRALAVSRKIGFLEGRLRLADRLLDAMADPVVVAGFDGRVVFANERARTLLARHDGLDVDGGRLIAARAAETARLRQLIATAITRGTTRGGQMAISRPSGGRPLSVLVAPAGPEVAAPFPLEACAVLWIVDPDAVPVTVQAALRTCYGLTAAEAAMVEVLASGTGSLRDAAEQLGITRNTAKTQLQRAFEKTGTHRQRELVKLALSLSGPYRPNG